MSAGHGSITAHNIHIRDNSQAMAPIPIGEQPLQVHPNSHTSNGHVPQLVLEQYPPHSQLNPLTQTNGHAHQYQVNGGQRISQRRPLTVDEALQYAPFSSIVSFDHCTSLSELSAASS